MRRDYGQSTRTPLLETDLAPTWLEQFQSWFADAVAAGLPEPNAMVVATADADGRPSVRTVLLKGVDDRGLVFFTNYHSRKGSQLAANPYAGLLFPWHPLTRQVAVTGRVERIDRAETEAYFASRPRESQLGAWASPQSQVVGSRAELDEAYDRTAEQFAGDDAIPPPPHWGGFRVRPDTVEFWQGREGRLHDRLRYRATGDMWVIERLGP
jgi:pyridoxamine 5'-phosphate oxidase